MSTPSALAITPEAMAALRAAVDRRHYVTTGQAGTEALAAAARPLTAAERKALNAALEWWQQERARADEQVRAITARLARR